MKKDTRTAEETANTWEAAGVAASTLDDGQRVMVMVVALGKGTPPDESGVNRAALRAVNAAMLGTMATGTMATGGLVRLTRDREPGVSPWEEAAEMLLRARSEADRLATEDEGEA